MNDHARIAAKNKLPYPVFIPRGHRTLACEYCNNMYGRPYHLYNPTDGSYAINQTAVWSYDSKRGHLLFKEPGNEHILSFILLSK